MSMEEQIKRRHELEDKFRAFAQDVEQYRREAKRMQIRDLEIGMARLIDKIDSSNTTDKQLDYRFKGLLLKSAYDHLRTSNSKKGFFSWLAGPAFDVDTFVRWRFHYPIPISESAVNEWAHCEPLDPSRLLPAPEQTSG